MLKLQIDQLLMVNTAPLAEQKPLYKGWKTTTRGQRVSVVIQTFSFGKFSIQQHVSVTQISKMRSTSNDPPNCSDLE